MENKLAKEIALDKAVSLLYSGDTDKNPVTIEAFLDNAEKIYNWLTKEEKPNE